MKTIYLLRHAKSSWAYAGLEDQKRPLNKRGKRDAPLMGTRFKVSNENIDLIITSPALRALSTAQLFAEAIGLDAEQIIEDSELYFSGERAIPHIIQSQDDHYASLMLVFHNPDITAFTNSIAGSYRIDNIPTCGLVKLVSETDYWGEWSRSNTELEYFDYPKKIIN